MKTTYGLVFLFILTLFTGCKSDDTCEGFEPQLTNLVVKLQLIDSETQENLITNGTYSFENLTVVSQNGSSVNLIQSDNDILLMAFEYNGAEGNYDLKNSGNTLFQFNVSVKEVKEPCYLYNAIESVGFTGAESLFDSASGTYTIYL